jgi:hypothetical protein
MEIDIHLDWGGGNMTHTISAYGLLGPNGRRDPLVYDAILVFAICVLAIALAVAFCCLVLPQVNADIFHGGSPGSGLNVAHWSALSQLSLPDGPGDLGSELAQAFARGLEQAGRGWTGLLSDPFSAPKAAKAP